MEPESELESVPEDDYVGDGATVFDHIMVDTCKAAFFTQAQKEAVEVEEKQAEDKLPWAVVHVTINLGLT